MRALHVTSTTAAGRGIANTASVAWLGGRGGPKQVPSVAFAVAEDGDGAVGFHPGEFDERHLVRLHPGIGRGEVVYTEKEADSPRELRPDQRLLRVALGAGQHQPRCPPFRAHHHPSLGPAVGGECGFVGHEIKVERSDKEVDRGLIVPDQQGGELEVRHGYRGGRACAVLAQAHRFWMRALHLTSTTAAGRGIADTASVARAGGSVGKNFTYSAFMAA